MAYSTLAQLTERYSERVLIQLSDRAAAPTGQIDQPFFDRVRADADARIDGYLKVRYALPLADIPRMVTDLSLRITFYYAHGQSAPDKVTEDYKDAVSTLRDISRGLIQLDAGGVEPAGSGGGEVRTNNPERPLSASSMKGYI